MDLADGHSASIKKIEENPGLKVTENFMSTIGAYFDKNIWIKLPCHEVTFAMLRVCYISTGTHILSAQTPDQVELVVSAIRSLVVGATDSAQFWV